MPPDAEVVRRVLGGELEFFEVLMRRYNQRLFRVARSILDDSGEAEDVLQETYVRAYFHLAEFKGRAKFATWLTKIAVYEALRRRRQRRRFVSLDFDRAEQAPAAGSPEHSASNEELRRALEVAIQELPTNYRVVFVLRELEGLSNTDTAESLGLSTAAVKVRLHRARKKLQRAIGSELGTEALQLYSFHLSRCDQVVERLFRRLTGSSL